MGSDYSMDYLPLTQLHPCSCLLLYWLLAFLKKNQSTKLNFMGPLNQIQIYLLSCNKRYSLKFHTVDIKSNKIYYDSFIRVRLDVRELYDSRLFQTTFSNYLGVWYTIYIMWNIWKIINLNLKKIYIVSPKNKNTIFALLKIVTLRFAFVSTAAGSQNIAANFTQL